MTTCAGVGVGGLGVAVGSVGTVGAALPVDVARPATDEMAVAVTGAGARVGREAVARTGDGTTTDSGVICGGASRPSSTFVSVRIARLLRAKALSSAHPATSATAVSLVVWPMSWLEPSFEPAQVN